MGLRRAKVVGIFSWIQIAFTFKCVNIMVNIARIGVELGFDFE